MIIASKGIIVEKDEITVSSIADGIVILSHNRIEKAVKMANRIAYDATSEQAVDSMLSVDTSSLEVNPLIAKPKRLRTGIVELGSSETKDSDIDKIANRNKSLHRILAKVTNQAVYKGKKPVEDGIITSKSRESGYKFQLDLYSSWDKLFHIMITFRGDNSKTGDMIEGMIDAIEKTNCFVVRILTEHQNQPGKAFGTMEVIICSMKVNIKIGEAEQIKDKAVRAIGKTVEVLSAEVFT